MRRAIALAAAFLTLANAAWADGPPQPIIIQPANPGAAGSVNGIVQGNGAGTVSAVTVGSGLTYSGGTLSSTSGSVNGILQGNGSGTVSAVTIGSGLTYSGGILSTTSSGVAPNLLKFGPPTVLPYYDPQPAGLIDVTDNFASTGTFTQLNNTGTPSLAVASNVGTVTLPTVGAFAFWQETSDSTLTAPQTFTAVTMPAVGTPGGAGYLSLYTGICKDATHFFTALYDEVNHSVFWQYANGGASTSGTTTSVTLTAGALVGFSLTNNVIGAWYKPAGGAWTLGAANSQATVDFTASGALTGWKTCFGASANAAGGTVQVSVLQGGRYGGVGMRDIKPVVNPDWTTYQPGGNSIYFVATTVGPTGIQNGSLSDSSQGVFTLNLTSQAITETGVICDSFSSHVYCGDVAGNLIYHSNGDREFLWSNWETPSPVNILYKYVTSGSQGDLLTTNLSVLSSPTTLTVPGQTGSFWAYDPALAFDAVHSRYLLTYTISNLLGSSVPTEFYPALASASTPTGTWTSIGIDSSLQGDWEGTSFANVGGVLYELAAGPRFPNASPIFTGWPSCALSRVYDETFTLLGQELGTTFINAAATGPVNCSHPTLFQHPDGQHIVLFTFNGTQYKSIATATGQPMIEISTQ